MTVASPRPAPEYFRRDQRPPYFLEAESHLSAPRVGIDTGYGDGATESDGVGATTGRNNHLRPSHKDGASSALGLDLLEAASVAAAQSIVGSPTEVSTRGSLGDGGPGGGTRLGIGGTGPGGEADVATGSRIRSRGSIGRFLGAATDTTSPYASSPMSPPLYRGQSTGRDGLGRGDGTVGGGPAGGLGGGKRLSWSVLHSSSAGAGTVEPVQGNIGTMDTAGSLKPALEAGLAPTWRLKERMKTVGVGMILALNIGTDPPDVNKPNPCAKLQCWIDPSAMSRAKARERIGERLEQQYARWQQRAKLKYKRALDPTVEDVRGLCVTMRRQARGERLLLHFNGHGVPRPTADGEIYVFDKNHTHFIPLSVLDLRRWIGKPSIIVLDCGGAGVLMPFLIGAMDSISVGTGAPIHGGERPDGSAPPDLRDGHVPGGVGSAGPISPSPLSLGQKNVPSSPDAMEGESDAAFAARSVRDTIVLCPTSAGELLPMNPEFPADIFTSCLTTPIPIALRWFVHQNPLSCGGLDLESVDSIPGKVNDRKTPLGELNWIFTAVTDTIAWNVLPSPLFQRLFRQDLIVASMFRNFLLADRILRSLGCTPLSYPALPGTNDHHLWQAWDLAVETCLNQLVKDGVLGPSAPVTVPVPPGDDIGEGGGGEETDRAKATSAGPQTQQQAQAQRPVPAPTTAPTGSSAVTAPFFSEQLTAFEIWLEFAATSVNGDQRGVDCRILGPPQGDDFGGRLGGGLSPIYDAARIESPEQLPVVLQVLLSQAHRVRALVLLRQFLDLGPSAVNLALSVGIFPYVLKLLQSSIDEYKHVLVGIWAKILQFDPSCQVDLVKDGALPHFIRHLNWGLAPHPSGASGATEDAAEQRTMAAVILSAICLNYSLGQAECLKKDLHGSCSTLLLSTELDNSDVDDEGNPEGRAAVDKRVPSLYRLWLCLCLGNLTKDSASAQAEAYKADIHLRLFARLEDDSPDVRAGACYALGCLMGSSSTDSSDGVDESVTTAVTHGSRPVVLQIPSSVVAQVPSGLPIMGMAAPPPQSMGPSTTNGIGVGMGVGAVPGLNPTLLIDQTAPPGMVLQPLGPPGPAHFLPQQSVLQPGIGPNVGVSPAQQFQPQVPYGVANMPGALPPGIAGAGLMPVTGPVGAEGQPIYPPMHPHGVVPPLQLHSQHPPGLFHQQMQQMHVHQQRRPQRQPTVLDDHRRLDFDVANAKKLIMATEDASPTVRYEAMLSLGYAVRKYLQAFAAVAEAAALGRVVNALGVPPVVVSDLSSIGDLVESERSSLSPGCGAKRRDLPGDRESSIPLPPGLTEDAAVIFGEIWSALRLLQRGDPQPVVSATANAIVSIVHEHILIAKTSSEKGPSSVDGSKGLPLQRCVSSLMMDRRSSNRTASIPPQMNRYGSYGHDLPALRRNKSYQVVPGKGIVGSSANSRWGGTLSTAENSGIVDDSVHIANGVVGLRIQYSLPNSRFYEWKRDEFSARGSGGGGGDGGSTEPSSMPPLDMQVDEMYIPYSTLELNVDPLSADGALRSYRDRRNTDVLEQSALLAEEFAVLAPKPPRRRGRDAQYDNNDVLFDDLNDETTVAYEVEVSAKKSALHLSQSALLLNEGKKMTSMLRFHPYEPVLVACDGYDSISVWDIDNGDNSPERMCVFNNGNPKGSRMTAVTWMNELTSSLLLTGSDDGTIRIWDGILDFYGAVNCDQPQLSSAFVAAPELNAGERGSGLVVDWQQFNGRLITGGNSKKIRCWDLEAEKCGNILENSVGGCVTTLTTAWDFSMFGDGALDRGSNSTPGGYSGIGPDVIVSGHSNGSLKVFDIRAGQGPVANVNGSAESPRSQRRLRRRKLTQFSEHQSWIVSTSFTGFCGRYEIMSGCVGGDIKFWDLRMQESLRTLDVQRSPMTALASHPSIPLLATGSHAQFIKILALDGDTLQVIRYHEEIAGQRIGPVSCLCFHPHMPLLAAGATDEIISLYSPDKVQNS